VALAYLAQIDGVEVNIAEERFSARLSRQAAFDPKGSRLRARALEIG
jgi:hypothetical protein